MALGETVLNAEQVTVHYGRMTALDRASLAIAAGEIVGLCGANGAGKSTFLKAALGLVPLAGGRLHVLGRAVGAPGYDRSRLGYVAQKAPGGQLPVTVWDAVAMGRYGRAGLGRALNGEDRARVRAALERLHLMHLQDRLVQEISGGQAQRVGIARALAQEPRLLFLDEPTSSLDQAGRMELAAEVQSLNQELGLTVVIVSHDPEVAKLCRRLYWFEAGRAREVAGLHRGAGAWYPIS